MPAAWGPSQFVSYQLINRWPSYFYHRHNNINLGANFPTREVEVGKDNTWWLGTYDVGKTDEYVRLTFASYSWGFAK